MGKTVEKAKKKGKKKGRPSLLDLQKRSLRLQKQHELDQQQHKQQKHRSPNPNPYLRPVPPTSGRRTARRSTNSEGPETADEEEEEEYEDEDDEGGGRRREKNLNLVLRATPDGRSGDRGELGPSGSESEGEGRAGVKKRRVDAVGAVRGSTRDKGDGYKSYSKVADPSGGEASDSEEGTPLPDTQLLIFILDRLQKKDTYGVFSEPVDPDELPDYHDIIDHPMDFGTVRKKLGDGVYKTLEQFEKDVYLISSNAMHYNAPDTVYFRQARTIQDLATKDFENLRQETDEDEPDPQSVRRGRPPSKSACKKPIDRPPALLGGSNNSSAANAIDRSGKCTTSADTFRKGSVADKSFQFNMSSSRASQGSRNLDKSHLSFDLKFDRNDDPLGSVMKGLSSRYSKKGIPSEDNSRNSYNQPMSVASAGEPSILTTFDGETKELIPVGVHVEHAYARSLARFAANLGPIGWKITAEKIKRVLPPGAKFDRGWINEDDAAQRYEPPILPTSALPLLLRSDPPEITESDREPEETEGASENLSDHIAQSSPGMTAGTSIISEANQTTGMPAGTSKIFEANQTTEISGGNDDQVPNVSDVQLKPPAEFHQNAAVHSNINGLNARFPYNIPQFEMMPNSAGQFGIMAGKLPMTYARGMDMGNKNNLIRPPAMGIVENEKSKYSLVGSGSSNFEQIASRNLDPIREKLLNQNTMNSQSNFVIPVSATNIEAERVSSHLDVMRGKLESRSTFNSQNNFAVPTSTTNNEPERVRLHNPGSVSSGSNFTNTVPTSRFEMETKRTNPNMANPVTSSMNDTLLGHFGTQRVIESSQSSVNVGNNSNNNLPMGNCLDMDRMKVRNVTSGSSIDSFNHPKSFNNSELERSRFANLGYVNPSYYYMHPTGTSQMMSDTSRMKIDGNPGEPVMDSQGPWRGSSLHQNSDSAPPDLNVRFQPPGSPASSALVDSQQPDLALQL